MNCVFPSLFTKVWMEKLAGLSFSCTEDFQCKRGCLQPQTGIVQSPQWKEVAGGSNTSSRWKVSVVTSQIPLSEFVIGRVKESNLKAERQITLMGNES